MNFFKPRGTKLDLLERFNKTDLISHLQPFCETLNTVFSNGKPCQTTIRTAQGNLGSSNLIHKERHQCRQTGSFFLAWKKCCSYLSAGEVSLTRCISGHTIDQNMIEGRLLICLYRASKPVSPN